jgi:hypothetical protein
MIWNECEHVHWKLDEKKSTKVCMWKKKWVDVPNASVVNPNMSKTSHFNGWQAMSRPRMAVRKWCNIVCNMSTWADDYVNGFFFVCKNKQNRLDCWRGKWTNEKWYIIRRNKETKWNNRQEMKVRNTPKNEPLALVHP